ncbi:MAG: hypothetical protein IJ630_10825 [Treponema sp.]|nr:hypothetical protein [Treponema sp.]
MIFKRFLFSLLIFFTFSNAFSSGGVMSGSSSPLHVIRTEYFDIIFAEESRETANKIASVCDDYYLEITKKLETDAYQRFPVTITRSVELLNAYYAAVPYNRIVLYDTLPEESLDMYEDTIQSVFYHELTHAVTYNMKGKALRKLSFFSDMMNPAWLTVTTFWAEGATVSFESKGRGGRLNDPFSTQLANQAKIEGNFPSWRDVTGARDTYPGGTDAYIFGSMFASYLQEKYGMSKYADFWKEANKRLTLRYIASVFEKAYDNHSITEEWREFEKTLEIEHAEKNAALLSNKKSRITAFDAHFSENEAKIAYFDSPSQSLRLITLEKSADGQFKLKKNKKLLAISGITRISFSLDGQKIALSRTIDKKTYKCVTAEYELKRGRYKENGVNEQRDAFFMKKDGQDSLGFVQIEGSKASARGIILQKDSEIPYSPIPISENLNACIIKDGLEWKIRLSVIQGADDFKVPQISDYEISGGMSEKSILHNLHLVSCDEKEIFLSFVWATLGEGGKMLSRAGILKIDRATMKGSFFLQKENAFAGFIDAVCEKPVKDDTFTFFVIAAEYDRNPLYSIQIKISDFALSDATTAVSSEQERVEKRGTDYKEIPYSSFRYYKKGIFLPFLGLVPIYNHDFEQDTTAILGLTFISTNPWGDKQILFTAGFDSSYKNGGAQLSISGGNDSLSYSLSGSAIFDKDGFMQTADTLSLAKVLWSGRISTLSLGFQGQFLYGRQIIDDELEENRDESNAKSADALAYLKFTNIHKISPGVYKYAGFSLQPFVLSSYRDTENLFEADKYINAGTQASLRFPIFLPFIFTATLFPSRSYVAQGTVMAILFDCEIHKGIPAISIFAQRFLLSASYTGKFTYMHDKFWDIKRTDEILKNIEKDDYSDAISLSADFHLTPNTGYMATGEIQFRLGYSVIYRPNPKSNEKRLGYGLSFEVVY